MREKRKETKNKIKKIQELKIEIFKSLWVEKMVNPNLF